MSKWDITVLVERRSKRGFPKHYSATFDVRFLMALIVAVGFWFGFGWAN